MTMDCSNKETKLFQQQNQDLEQGESNDGMMFPNLLIVGICGSIGSGKSFTSKLLVSKLNSIGSEVKNEDDHEGNENGHENTIAFHIDTDSLAHGVYTPGSVALKEIQAEFGSTVINEEDGTVNRKALGAIVFSDDKQMSVSSFYFYFSVKVPCIHDVHVFSLIVCLLMISSSEIGTNCLATCEESFIRTTS